MENKDKHIMDLVLMLIISVLVAYIFKECHPKKERNTIPKQEFEFKSVKPIHKIIDTIFLPKFIKTKEEKTKIVYLEKQTQQLLDTFKNSNKKDSLYNDAIQLHEFSQIFENEKAVINVNGVARGTVEMLKASCIIKEQKVLIPEKKSTSVYVGAELGTNLIEINPKVKANLLLEHKKTIYSIGYDTNKNLWLGASFRLF